MLPENNIVLKPKTYIWDDFTHNSKLQLQLCCEPWYCNKLRGENTADAAVIVVTMLLRNL